MKTIESDKTVDLSMSPAEANMLDSQWRGTFDLGAKQGQTIRQRETVTGFRSSLPVKSRYIREKRKAPSAPPKTAAEVPDYELLDIIGEGPKRDELQTLAANLGIADRVRFLGRQSRADVAAAMRHCAVFALASMGLDRWRQRGESGPASEQSPP